MKPKELKDLSLSFKTLAHAKRLEIICLLHGHDLTVNQIVQMTALRQATVSQHLMYLKSHKVVQSTKLGKEIYYTLNAEIFKSLSVITLSLSKSTPIQDSEPTVIDPICYMHLTPSSCAYTVEYDGVRHYFCGKGCKKEFYAKHKI